MIGVWVPDVDLDGWLLNVCVTVTVLVTPVGNVVGDAVYVFITELLTE